jgi:hypothetical protein
MVPAALLSELRERRKNGTLHNPDLDVPGI